MPCCMNSVARWREGQTQERRVSDFFELGITPNLFAEDDGIAFDVEQVVSNLKRPADVVTIAFEGLHLCGSASS